MARLFAFGLGLVFALFPSVPAQADHYQVTWNSPNADNTSLVGDATVDFTLSSTTAAVQGKVKSWTLTVKKGTTVLGTFCSSTYASPYREEVNAEFQWNTRFLPTQATGAASSACDNGTENDPKLPSTESSEYYQYSENTTYTLTVSAVLGGGLLSHSATPQEFTQTVRLDNDPSTPSNVRASWDSASQQMTVRWDTSPEPDVTGYVVEQCFKGSSQSACAESDWAQVGTPSGRTNTSLSQTVTSAGTYRYRVKAQRPASGSSAPPLPSGWGTSDAVALQSSGGGSGGTGGDDDDGTDTSSPGSGGGGGTSPGSGGSGSTTPTTGESGNGAPGSGPDGGAGGENERDLPPRLVERTEVDAGYEEALPYGAQPLDPSDAADGLASAARGVGLALVPIAGGLALFVFSMQMRYLSHRAGALAVAQASGPGAGCEALAMPPPPEPAARPPSAPSASRGGATPLRLGAGGSFISNWRQLLEPRSDPGEAPTRD